MEGQVVQVYGRKTDGHLRKGTELHSWLREDLAWVFNEAVFGTVDELIVCEGLIDALTLWSSGLRSSGGMPLTVFYDSEGRVLQIDRGALTTETLAARLDQLYGIASYTVAVANIALPGS